MTNYLMDTNALSEPAKSRPDTGFSSWLKTTNDDTLFTSIISLGEIKKGVMLISDKVRNQTLNGWLAKTIAAFEGRIISVDLNVALLWGDLVAGAQQAGKTASAIDALIAAQCIQNNLTLVTRNVRDFEQFEDLLILCPWRDLSN